MADKIKGIVVNIGGDVTGLNNALKSVNKNINYTQKELKDVEKLLKLDPKNTELLAQKQSLLSKAIQENTDKLNALKKAKNDADEAMRKGTEVNQEQYRKLQREISNTENKLKSLNNSSSKLEKLSADLNKFGTSATAAGKSLLPLSVGIVAAGTAAVKTGIDFESAFAGVRKTTEATEEEYEKLKQGILDMSKALPATAVEIAEVAESAGQLGISKDKLLEFTRTMIDLGEATNLTSTEAASSLAKFANITNMSADQYSNLGSTIVALGNNFATTEADIVSMATKLASTGELVGISEAEIMALATTMSSVGIEAEAGGSAMSKLLKQIQTAVELGGTDLRRFASVARMTSNEFKSAFEKNAVSTLAAFIGGLNDTERNGKSAIAILNDMGLTEVRLSNTILSLANANNLMTDAVALANSAWNENTALSKEAEQRYATTASKLAMLGNKMKEIGIQIAEHLLPAVNSAVDKVGEWTEKFSNLDEKTQKTIVTIAGVVAVIAPLLIMLGKTATATSSIITLVKTWELATKAQTAAQAALNLAMNANPISLATAAIVGISAAFAVWSTRTTDQMRLQKELNDLTEEATNKYTQANNAIESQLKSEEANVRVMEQLSAKLYDLADKEEKSTQEKRDMATIVEKLNELIPDLNLEIDGTTGALNLEKSAVDGLIGSYKSLAIAKSYQSKVQAEADRLVAAEEKKRKAEEAYTPEKREQVANLLANGMPKSGAAWYQHWGVEEVAIEEANQEIADATKKMEEYQQKVLEYSQTMNTANTENVTSSNKTTKTIVDDTQSQIKAQTEAVKTEEEISKEKLQNAEKYLNDKKYYNQMSTYDEIEYWETFKETSNLAAAELEEVNKKIYSSRVAYGKELLQYAEKYAEDLKYFDKMSTEEELNYWENMRKIAELGSDEVYEIDKKIYSLKKTLAEEEQKRTEEQIAAMEEVTKKYNEQFTSRANALKNFNGIFNEVAEHEDVSGKELLKRLKDQVKEFEKWQKNLAKLAERGLDSGVIEELTEAGPNSLDKVNALLELSDKQISEYSSQYQKLGQLASEQALKELGPLETSLSNIKGSLATLNEDIAYAVAPTSTLTNESSTKAKDPEEMQRNLLELITQLAIEAGDKVADSVFAAIPDYVKIIMNSKELASVAWKDFEEEANRHGKNWYTREEIASIARSVMPRPSEG